ncbi:MAG: sigma-70 family RNA polymerase sigma factor [Verrucomicrobiales bacterium]|nr:sigma-70 family RNA polymerase sigma factor [Verrucomicrobiales bacterium]MCP5525824.1 sigma-70 family RNA polymerase sigma factor [Verrucomicrobiales bacterium]
MGRGVPDQGVDARSSLFPTTHWSVVLGAGERAEEALSRLCEAYRPPIYAYLMALGHDHHETSDFVQGFFVHLLRPATLARLNAPNGRFRAFLLTTLQNYVRDRIDHRRARKRGGDAAHLSLETPDGMRVEGGVVGQLTPEQWFDRKWGETVVKRALARVREEVAQAGRGDLFAALLPLLYRDPDALPYDELARTTGLTAGALRNAKSRILRRLRQLIREELALTLPPEVDLDEELRYLMTVMGGPGLL